MSEPGRQAELAQVWERARPRLTRVAYSMLGSVSDAEDVVADCWLRLVAADAKDVVRDVDAWATVTVARAALDVLRSARVRREVYPGPWLPEPLVQQATSTADGAGAGLAVDPADRVSLDETVSYALLVVLESLSPAERTAWVLHDLFAMPFAEVAQTVGRTPAAVRQLAARARSHVVAHAPRVSVSRSEHTAAVERFLHAAGGGDLGALIAVLDPDVVLTSDGGGQVSAARRPVLGADRVARFLRGVTAKIPSVAQVLVRDVNGLPGLLVLEGDRLTAVTSFTVVDGRITRVDLLRAPAKLDAVHAALATPGQK
jgi:RNA polymerase sigma-70 factor (ECF subfamily)